jgi:YesN/AraC family two-component response regulator
MIKVIIVDDEFIEREGIKKTTNWVKHGLCLAI